MRTMPMRTLLMLLIVAALDRVAAAAPAGGLTQLAGLDACTSATGSGGTCRIASSLDRPQDLAVSPDGRFVYVVSDLSNSVTAFSRDLSTGALAPLGGGARCVSGSTADGCTAGRSLAGANAVRISPDGKHLYVTARDSDGVAIFTRNVVTGALTQLPGANGCIDKRGLICTKARVVAKPNGLAISADGKNVYVASEGDNGIAIFRRNATTGLLSQSSGAAGCITNSGLGGCTNGRVLVNPLDVEVTPDGQHVYVATRGRGGALGVGEVPPSVAILQRNVTTGALSQRSDVSGCVTNESGQGCSTSGRFPTGVSDLAATDRAVFATTSTGLLAFVRSPGTGGLVNGGCRDANGSPGCEAISSQFVSPVSVDVGPQDLDLEPNEQQESLDSRSVYTASGNTDALFAHTALGALPNLVAVAGASGCAVDPSGAGCTNARALNGATAVHVSPDGHHVYVTSALDDAIAVFERELPPSCTGGDDTITVAANTTTFIPHRCRDANRDAITLSVVEAPAHGSILALNANPKTFRYAPTSGFVGIDSFVLSASDGDNATSERFTVQVVPGNGTPVCNDAVIDLTYTPIDGATVPIELACEDPDGDPLTLTIDVAADGPLDVATFPVDGTVGYTITLDAITANLAANGSAIDSFAFHVSDGARASTTAIATIILPPSTAVPPPLAELTLGTVTLTIPAKGKATLGVPVQCGPNGSPQACAGSISVRLADGSSPKIKKRTLEPAAFEVATNATSTVPLTLTRRLTRVARKLRRLDIVLELTGSDAQGIATTAEQPLTVVAP